MTIYQVGNAPVVPGGVGVRMARELCADARVTMHPSMIVVQTTPQVIVQTTPQVIVQTTPQVIVMPSQAELTDLKQAIGNLPSSPQANVAIALLGDLVRDPCRFAATWPATRDAVGAALAVSDRHYIRDMAKAASIAGITLVLGG